MQKAAPLTKLILTIFVTIWAIMLNTATALAMLIGTQLIALMLSRVNVNIYKSVIGLFAFALILGGLQYVSSDNLTLAAVTSLKMIAMTLVFIILLATTRMQDLSTALVTQCRVPYEYAFMLTAALRFIPDFLTESKIIHEAQSCRGFSARGNPIARITAYMAIVKPLVLKAVRRSELMALSIELRGFGRNTTRSFNADVKLSPTDYAMLTGMTVITLYIIIL